MSRRRLAAGATALALTPGLCVAAIDPCPPLAGCGSLAGFVAAHASAPPAGLALLLAAGLVASVGRASWSAVRLAHRLRRQRHVPVPAALHTAMRRVGIDDVRCLDDGAPVAFCAGLFGCRIYVSTGLVRRLRPAELDAVLLHELDHVRRREPLRTLLRSSLAGAFFFVPLLGWYARQRQEVAELRADRAAIERSGPAAVAGALWAVGGVNQATTAGFVGAMEARVAQVLGDPLPERRLDAWLLAGSAIGLGLAWVVASCAAHGAAPLLSTVPLIPIP